MTEKPIITARFLLEDGKPVFTEVGEKRHYRILLQVANAPDDTHGVTYELDESYYDPMRDVRNKPAFEESTSSYGDYEMQARVRRLKRVDLIAERLSTALERGHAGDMNPAIAEAIEYIRKH
jgi:hypothetical protein